MFLPNCLYVGPDKAGSTWLHRFFEWHPDVFVPAEKDLSFFDLNFHRGPEWYARFFSDAGGRAIRAELSHDYLFDADAPKRIRDTLGPDTILLINAREPVERAFSAYLYLRRLGATAKPFLEAISDYPDLLEHGRYATYLERLLQHFPPDRIHVMLFDELRRSPETYAQRICTLLSVRQRPLDERLKKAVLPASAPRSRLVAKAVRFVARKMRQGGQVRVLGRVKRWEWLNRLLYREFTGRHERPILRPDEHAQLREYYYKEVSETERLTGLHLLELWGYAKKV